MILLWRLTRWVFICLLFATGCGEKKDDQKSEKNAGAAGKGRRVSYDADDIQTLSLLPKELSAEPLVVFQPHLVGAFPDESQVHIVTDMNWTVADSGMAAIDAKHGELIGLKQGSTTITAEFRGKRISKVVLFSSRPDSSTREPSDPSGFQAESLASGRVKLSWVEPNEPISGYRISYQSQQAPADCTAGTVIDESKIGNRTSYEIDGLNDQLGYHFRICSLQVIKGDHVQAVRLSRGTSTALTPPESP